MAAPTFWSKKPFFYPIGNTPPLCLTRRLAPEVPADILLLGCGDPRNILETVHFELGDGTRKLDFTCCDLETAVLARNILLLSAIADGTSWLNAWQFFYHFFINDASLETLLSQCRKLIDASHDLIAWNSSSYGKYMRFCTEESMIEIRQHWELYLATNGLSRQKKEALKKSFFLHMKQIREKSIHSDITILRAAGPLNQQASIRPGTQIRRMFWENGFLKGSISGITMAPHVNPAFAYCLAGSGLNVHHGTNPLLAFHLSPALSPIRRASQSSQITGSDLVDAAMTQFSTWCTSFRLRANAENPSVVIRIFAGDCIPFCHALRVCRSDKVKKTGTYSRPWGLSQINFTEDYGDTSSSPPLLFNVINTSNLIDHLGLLNLVLVTSPLLQRTPWSILQTDTFQSSASDKKIESALVDRIFCDIPTLSVLLGVAPSFHLHPFSTEGHNNEQATADVHFSQSISWECPYSVPSDSPEMQKENLLICDDLLLSKFLFSLYLDMFSEENPWTNRSLYKINYIHYIRKSFVEFLLFVKERLHVDWTKTMERFVDFLATDRSLLLGLTNYQDFICQLYTYDFYTMDTLRWDFLRSLRSPGDCYEGWQVVPPVVSVVLVVPRERLKVLEDSDQMDLGVPLLCCETRGANTQNLHMSIHFTFGNVVYSGQYADARVVITEDPAGWHGKSSMILSFDAASWIFTKHGGIRTVGLCVHPTPLFSSKLSSKLGLNMSVFTTPLTDKEHVFITRYRPNDSQDICRPNDNASASVQSRSPSITVGFNASATRIESLAIRKNIVDQVAAKTLANGAPITIEPVGNTAVRASYQDHSQLFQFPFPIDINRVKTKVARKSLYIEVIAPLRREVDSSAIASPNLFPIARSKTGFNLLNISYLKLSVLPALRLPLGGSQLLSSHLLLTLSDQERAKQQSSAAPEQKGKIVNLKESISTVISKVSRLGVPQIFALSSPTIGNYALIFVTDLKLDLSSQTVVADGCVIPLNVKNTDKVVETLQRSSNQDTISISTLDDEVDVWKSLLPAFVERCRTWQHGDECEYRQRGIPACSMDDGWDDETSPLCSCGLGKDLGAFAALDDWKPIRSQATRIAISPLFPLLPLQEPLKDIVSQLDGSRKTPTSPSDGSSCAQCGGPGQPKLLLCSRCKKISYCSQKCQKVHWKQHKAGCVAVAK